MRSVVPIDLLNESGGTQWANLGDWGDADEYPQAAEGLAVRLGRAAGLRRGQRVVDAGCGAGDQLRVWVDDFDVGGVTAIEADTRMARGAETRVKAWGIGDRVRVRTGDAARISSLGGPADCVLALDAAYFFHPRAAFLERSRAALRPGGVLAMADLTLGTGTSANMARLLAPLCGVPGVNLITPRGWVEALTATGFGEISVEDRTAEVLDGFCAWARRGGGPVTAGPRSMTSVALACFVHALGRLSESGGLGYAIITARAEPT